MKKIFVVFLLSLFSFNSFSQTNNEYHVLIMHMLELFENDDKIERKQVDNYSYSAIISKKTNNVIGYIINGDLYIITEFPRITTVAQVTTELNLHDDEYIYRGYIKMLNFVINNKNYGIPQEIKK